MKLNYSAGCKQPWTAGSGPDSDCQSQMASGCLAQDYQFQLAAGLTGARFSVPADRWLTGSSSWPLVYWPQDRLCLVSASSRPPRLPVPAGRWLTDARFPVPAGRWFDWCKIFSSGWPPVYWPQDRLCLVLPVPASR